MAALKIALDKKQLLAKVSLKKRTLGGGRDMGQKDTRKRNGKRRKHNPATDAYFPSQTEDVSGGKRGCMVTLCFVI